MYLLTKWEGRMGKYLDRGHGVRTERINGFTKKALENVKQ